MNVNEVDTETVNEVDTEKKDGVSKKSRKDNMR